MSRRIVSPCVGLCSTTVGDTVCRGCQRSDHEIRDWFGYDHATRQAVMQRLDGWRVAVAGRYLQVTDADRLQAQLERHGIRFRAEQPALSRAVELLRVGRERMRDIRRYGLAPRAAGAGLSPVQLHEAISTTLLARAEACRDARDPDEPTT
ncbi:DUF1289 domain-containing protein [Modicisalibacter tunisiensis]|uniref:DUF1289 domain-containing protein n=1 Tax=Modicisalibacter tunisiensis TaxID=390637 RepID=A0ABS7X2P3_9GAMM|nr:DUF1289 domain-containing protein [Modicisalibacter tunisiensis]MBZ9538351.1 DUF1289 domain-containing protein [Modicisalibacter tunisiensis]MBZ9568237.1 DUF1289 domain-containing protein [Modicisalibacter tunisiensis]